MISENTNVTDVFIIKKGLVRVLITSDTLLRLIQYNNLFTEYFFYYLSGVKLDYQFICFQFNVTDFFQYNPFTYFIFWKIWFRSRQRPKPSETAIALLIANFFPPSHQRVYSYCPLNIFGQFTNTEVNKFYLNSVLNV